MLKDFTTDNAKHVSPPAGTREHLPKSVDGNRGIANARDVRPIPPSSLWIDKASCFLFEGEDLAFFVDKGSTSVGQNDIWILFEQANARIQIGFMVEVIVGSPLKQGRRRELEDSIEVCDSPQVPLIANIMNAVILPLIFATDLRGGSLEALSQIRISKSLKVCANKLSSSSGKNSCPLNTGIPIESLGIELGYRALIRAEYVGRNGPDQQAPVGTTL